MIHSTAIVHKSAKIADSVEIGPYVVIGEDVTIAEGVRVGAHTVIEHASVGAGCRISPGAYIGTPPQDIQYTSEKTRLELGENCIVRECVTLNRATTKDDGLTRIGNDCFFMANSHVGHDCKVGNGVILTNGVALGGHVWVGDYAIIGGLSAVHQHVRIGTLSMVGGLSGIDRDVTPYTMAQGNRISLIGLNSIGLRRQGFSRQAMSQIKSAYKTIFLGLEKLDSAVAQVEAEGEISPELIVMLDFLKAPSKRGIARPRKLEKESEPVPV